MLLFGVTPPKASRSWAWSRRSGTSFARRLVCRGVLGTLPGPLRLESLASRWRVPCQLRGRRGGSGKCAQRFIVHWAGCCRASMTAIAQRAHMGTAVRRSSRQVQVPMLRLQLAVLRLSMLPARSSRSWRNWSSTPKSYKLEFLSWKSLQRELPTWKGWSTNSGVGYWSLRPRKPESLR